MKVKGKCGLKTRTMAKVKKRVFALSQGNNQAMQSHIDVEDQIIVELFGNITFG